MSREKIEENDQRLIKKIRDIVHNKEKPPAEKQHVWRAYYFWLPMLFVGLIVTGLMVFSDQSATISSENLKAAPPNTFEDKKAPVSVQHTDQIAETNAKSMENNPPEIAAISRKTPPKPPEMPSPPLVRQKHLQALCPI